MLGDQKIVVVGLKRLPAGGAIFGGVNLVARTGQRLGVQPAKIAVFIHHENPVAKFVRHRTDAPAGSPACNSSLSFIAMEIIMRKIFRRYGVFTPYGISPFTAANHQPMAGSANLAADRHASWASVCVHIQDQLVFISFGKYIW